MRKACSTKVPTSAGLGTQPETMQANLNAISALLRGKTIVTSLSYENVLANVREDDVVYMDPPLSGRLRGARFAVFCRDCV
jgi:DNA adenine methylase